MFPLSKVRRLKDWDARWWLCVRCRCCKHERTIPAAFFLNLFEPTRPLAAVVRRLYCSHCRAKQCRCKWKDLDALVGLPRQ